MNYFRMKGKRLALWSPVVGLFRSALALSSLVTIAATPTSSLFQPLWNIGPQPVCTGANILNIFCLFDPAAFDFVKAGACIALAAVISGYLPQLTCIIHYWIAFSIFNGISIPDGGDQIAAVLTLLLIPLCITDPRINHWRSAVGLETCSPWRYGTAMASLTCIKFQMSVVYLQSCIEKTSKTEWATGSNMYYTASGVFGFSDPLRDLLSPLLENELTVSLMTWSVLALEFALAVTLLIPRQFRPTLFVLAALFHLAIALLMGLWSFSFVMIAADLVLTLPLRSFAYRSGFALWSRGQSQDLLEAS